MYSITHIRIKLSSFNWSLALRSKRTAIVSHDWWEGRSKCAQTENKLGYCTTLGWLQRKDIASMDKKLFTPGPLGTSRSVKEAMLRDLGSRDSQFMETIRFIRSELLNIAGVSKETFTSVPLQGSGTFAVEAVLRTVTPRNGGKVLVLANGAYGKRLKQICDNARIESTTLQFSEVEPVDVAVVRSHLAAHGATYSTVAVVHSETSCGLFNPVQEIGLLVNEYTPGASYVVDAMSSFGAVPIEMEASHIDYLVSSANKCLEGVPGFAFVIARTEKLLACRGNCDSLSLDLVDQCVTLDRVGTFRFTPPTHTMLAFRQALVEFREEGGVAGRAKRYRDNNLLIRDGMKKLGFRQLLNEKNQGYMITAFHYPADPNFDFQQFYAKLNNLDQVIYPGKLTDTDCFRIGNIGQLFPSDMQKLLHCVEVVCREMAIALPLREK